MTNWASRIQELREQGGLTLTEIAKRADMPLSTVGDLATGRSKSPRYDAAVRLDRIHSEVCGPKRRRSTDGSRPQA